jgi:RPA family protein
MAFEEDLCSVDNDLNDDIYKLVVKVDDKTQSLKELYKDTYENGLKKKREVLNPEDLKKMDGMIMEQREEYNVLNLKSSNFDNSQGAYIIVDALANALTGDRVEYEIDLAKDQTSWKLFKNNIVISKLHVKVNKVIVAGVVGIKSIEME